jgi:hypothetical protein
VANLTVLKSKGIDVFLEWTGGVSIRYLSTAPRNLSS